MITYTLDTNIVTYLLKGLYDIDKKLKDELKSGNNITMNPITYYEICRGLLTVKSQNKLQTFKEICEIFGVVEFSKDVMDIAADIYVDLRQKGEIVEDADIIIAAISIHKGYTLVTNNEKHFNRIKGLKTANWIGK